jgi:leucyl/phenylalanyl-tRNA--protein transferase
MLRAYIDLHALGDAHSIEVWEGDILVAGLYGVYVAGVFSGESMFTRVTDGSKLAVLFLIDHLRSLGITWLDIEQLTPHFEALGAKEITRVDFMARLRAAASEPYLPFA